MAFVSSTILSAKSRDVSNDELENMFEQARSGISQGIGEAIEVLTDAGTLTEEIQIGIDKSRDLIDSKIDELHEQVFSPPEDEEAQKIAMNLEQNIFKAQSSSIDILTAEGDKVSISFSAAQGKSLYEQSSANQSSSSYELQQSSYSKRNFSYNVEGDLNEDEKAALGKLIEDVSRIQKSFFAGDIEKAFEKAAELSIEPSQIASFSMNLTQQTSISQKYNQVANNQNDETQRESQRIAQQLIPAIDFEKQFEQLQQRAEQLLSSSNNNINNFYDAIIKADFLLKPNSTPEEQLLRWHNIVDQL